jgi:AcrR family transcriptional regulator
VPNRSSAVLTNGTPSLTLQEKKQQLVKNAIWDAATDLFDEKGYDETTVDDIAERAGVSRRSFFRYFSSKSDLMAYGMVGYAAQLTNAIESCPPQYSLPEVFRHTVRAVARHVAAQPRTRKIIQIVVKYPAAREAQQSRVAELHARVEAAYALRIRARSKRDLMPGVLSELTLSVLPLIFRSWFEHGDEDISSTVDQVLITLGRVVCTDRQK